MSTPAAAPMRRAVTSAETPAKSGTIRNLQAKGEARYSRVVEMPPDEHDQALAYTSHLPHVLAAALWLPAMFFLWFTFSSLPNWQSGDRVKVVNGQITSNL
mgnify:CR=1 FL=1